MNRIDLILRPATEADSDLLFEWRNDPETIQNSLTKAEVKMETHRNWFQASLRNPDRKIFVGMLEGKPAGSVRLDKFRDGWELSWTVAPQYRGKGIGKKMVQAGTQLVTTSVYAKILPANSASIKIAKTAGFVEFDAAPDHILYCLTR